MNHKLLKALNKLYKYPNYDYDREGSKPLPVGYPVTCRS